MKRLFGYLKHHKLITVLAPLFKCLEACFELFVPLVIAGMIDRGIRRGNISYVLRMGGVLLLLALIGLSCSLFAQYFSAKAAAYVGQNLRNDLFCHIHSLGYPEIDALGSSTLITRMSSDINQIEAGVNMVLRLFMRSPFIVFGAWIMAFRISLRTALVFTAAIPLLSLVVFGILLLTMPRYRAVQRQLDRIMKSTRENLLGVRVIRAFNREESEEQDFQRENDLLTEMQVRVGRISALLNPVTLTLIDLAVACLLYLGARLVNRGELFQGDIVALTNYMSQILAELIKLANLIILMSRAYASLGRVNEIFLQPSENEGYSEEEGQLLLKEKSVKKEEELLKRLRKDEVFLAFHRVSFRYSKEAENVLTEISLEVKKGETIGIIGGTGAGKSSLVNLIPRFYDASSGFIALLGRDIREIPLEELRSRIGVVPQRSVLFSGTLRENMCWGKKDATDEEIREALRIAQALPFVEEKGEGLSLLIEQEGRNLSGGQRQRLCIARALLRRPEILILDDSASALDFATDAALRSALREYSKDSTVFLISQRVASVRNSDRILVLEDGHMAGLGKHDLLFRESPVYREICLSQLSREEAEE